MADIIAMRLLIFQSCDISIANNYTIISLNISSSLNIIRWILVCAESLMPIGVNLKRDTFKTHRSFKKSENKVGWEDSNVLLPLCPPLAGTENKNLPIQLTAHCNNHNPGSLLQQAVMAIMTHLSANRHPCCHYRSNLWGMLTIPAQMCHFS